MRPLLAAFAAILVAAFLYFALSGGFRAGGTLPATPPPDRSAQRSLEISREASVEPAPKVPPNVPGNSLQSLGVRTKPSDRDSRLPLTDVAQGTGRLTLNSVRSRTLVGRVVDSNGSALEAARVVVLARGVPAERVEARTDPGGTFSIGIASGDDERRVEVTNDGHGRRVFRVRPSLRGDGSDTVDVGDLVLERAGSVSGRLLTTAGRPVPSLEVVLRGPTPSAVTPSEVLAAPTHQFDVRTSDAEGEFTFGDLPAGHYSLEVHPDPGSGLAAAATDLDLAVAQDLFGADLILRPTAKVECTVVDTEGRPVLALLTSIESRDGAATGEAARKPEVLTAATGAEGKVVFHNAPPGHYRVRVDEATAEIVDFTASEFDVAESHITVPITVIVRLFRTIAGRITDTLGRPGAGLVVIAMPERPSAPPGEPSPPRRGHTRLDGLFTVSGLPDGEYRLEVMRLRAEPGEAPLATVESVAAGATDVEIVVEM